MPRKKKKKKKVKLEIETIDEISILNLMHNAGKPLALHEIKKALKIKKSDKGVLKDVLNNLLNQGKIILTKGNKYGLSDLMDLITGKITIHPDGFGFVRAESKTIKNIQDIFIPPKGLKGAIDGDRVIVRIEKIKGKRAEGSVIRILERTTKRLVGTFHVHRSLYYVTPEDEKYNFDIIIPKEFTRDARDGDAVWVEITEFPQDAKYPLGKIVEVLGDPLDMSVQTKIVTKKHNLPSEFSAECLAECEEIPEYIPEDEINKRTDLRNLHFVTIDGENARDFDDAVFVKKTRNGYILYVSIADVSHYVKKDSAIDKDAYERGTSVYFPQAVIPMLPEKLSNNLCSLIPNKDRLTMTVEIWYDREGNVRRSRFYPSVINSKMRLTYTKVWEMIQHKTSRGINPSDKPLFKLLKTMEELCDILSKKRTQRGSIDFDLPEPEVIIGLSGNMEDIIKRERNKAHRIIEEFMIAANEEVAKLMFNKVIPTLYRIHSAPDPLKIADFVNFTRTLGFDIDMEEISPKWCQDVLKKVANTPQEYVVNNLLLRSMQQAIYSPDNIGHFGLASTAYLHFTSPIRRYPDLIVHRILKRYLENKRSILYSYDELKKIGEDTSQTERRAMEAEREMLERLKVRFMADKIGEVFDGVISAVVSFGFFVELKNIFVEGAVRLVDLADDYYIYDQDRHRLVGRYTKKIYQIGTPVKVRLKNVNIRRRHINFEVVNEK